jgi:predicted transcriptional regulator
MNRLSASELALASLTRQQMRVVGSLLELGSASCWAVASAIGRTESQTHRHLCALRDAGIAAKERLGRVVFWRLA